MIGKIVTYFKDNILGDSAPDPEDREDAIRKATAALLVEVMITDGELATVEEQTIIALLQQHFGLQAKQANELLALAKDEVGDATSLYQFTGQINLHLSNGEKLRLMEKLWHVALADHNLDKYEEDLIRKVAELIHIPHSQFVRTRNETKRKT